MMSCTPGGVQDLQLPALCSGRICRTVYGACYKTMVGYVIGTYLYIHTYIYVCVYNLFKY